jgi:hypothetical protein
MALAKRTKSAGLQIDVLCGKGVVFCRMYRSLSEVVAGYSKNLFAFSNFKIIWLGVFLVYSVQRQLKGGL